MSASHLGTITLDEIEDVDPSENNETESVEDMNENSENEENMDGNSESEDDENNNNMDTDTDTDDEFSEEDNEVFERTDIKDFLQFFYNTSFQYQEIKRTLITQEDKQMRLLNREKNTRTSKIWLITRVITKGEDVDATDFVSHKRETKSIIKDFILNNIPEDLRKYFQFVGSMPLMEVDDKESIDTISRTVLYQVILSEKIQDEDTSLLLKVIKKIRFCPPFTINRWITSIHQESDDSGLEDEACVQVTMTMYWLRMKIFVSMEDAHVTYLE